MNMTEAIKERRSVRSFDGNGLNESQRRGLLDAIQESYSPFGGKLTIRLKEYPLEAGYRPGTYGVIKGASDFFLLGMGDDEASALTAGFQFEQIVLKAWILGLGTCWIAGTFKNSDFDKGETWPSGEKLRIICPVGVAVKKSLREKIMRIAVKSDNRRPFNELFFYNDFQAPLPSDSKYVEPLEMMRLAPSSTNSQPWRALVIEDTIHFYYKLESKYSVLDCGIGLFHFYETETLRGGECSFFKTKDAPTPLENWKYLISAAIKS